MRPRIRVGRRPGGRAGLEGLLAVRVDVGVVDFGEIFELGGQRYRTEPEMGENLGVSIEAGGEDDYRTSIQPSAYGTSDEESNTYRWSFEREVIAELHAQLERSALVRTIALYIPAKQIFSLDSSPLYDARKKGILYIPLKQSLTGPTNFTIHLVTADSSTFTLIFLSGCFCMSASSCECKAPKYQPIAPSKD